MLVLLYMCGVIGIVMIMYCLWIDIVVGNELVMIVEDDVIFCLDFDEMVM